MSQSALKVALGARRQESPRGEKAPESFSADEVAHLQDALEEKLGAVSLEELRNQTASMVSTIVTGLIAQEKAVL